MYDAQGNAFDYRALALRVGHGVRVWLAGGALPATAWPGGAELARLFQDIRDGLPAGLGPLASAPFPPDLAAALAAGPLAGRDSASSDFPAAGTGRERQ